MTKKLSKGRLGRYRNWETALFHDANRRAKKKGIEIEITKEFIAALWIKQERKCFWSGLEMAVTLTPRHPLQPSIERLDNTKGYTKDNCVLVCLAMNNARNSISVELWMDFLTKWKEEGSVRNLEVQDP